MSTYKQSNDFVVQVSPLCFLSNRPNLITAFAFSLFYYFIFFSISSLFLCRPPEILLGSQQYTTTADVWSVGCIFAELITGKALFPGKNEVNYPFFHLSMSLCFLLLSHFRLNRFPTFSAFVDSQRSQIGLGSHLYPIITK